MLRRRDRLFRANSGGYSDLNYAACAASITTPVDSTITVPFFLTYCSAGAIEIDSVAAGAGIVVIDGAWRLYNPATIGTPIDEFLYLTDPADSVGAIEIDSVAAGDGIVEVQSEWRLT